MLAFPARRSFLNGRSGKSWQCLVTKMSIQKQEEAEVEEQTWMQAGKQRCIWKFVSGDVAFLWEEAGAWVFHGKSYAVMSEYKGLALQSIVNEGIQLTALFCTFCCSFVVSFSSSFLLLALLGGTWGARHGEVHFFPGLPRGSTAVGDSCLELSLPTSLENPLY